MNPQKLRVDLPSLAMTRPAVAEGYGVAGKRRLRRASNETRLRAFRNADRFPTFKIVRRPGAFPRRLALGQSRRSDWISVPDPLTVRSSVFTFLPYGSYNYFSSDKKTSGMDRAGRRANGRVPRPVHPLAPRTGARRRS